MLEYDMQILSSLEVTSLQERRLQGASSRSGHHIAQQLRRCATPLRPTDFSPRCTYSGDSISTTSGLTFLIRNLRFHRCYIGDNDNI